MVRISISAGPKTRNYKQILFLAIIGGGIGGTSCAFFLEEIFKEKAEIHVYEGNKIGGRLATASMSDGNEYETGGSIIHGRNKYMSDFVRDLGNIFVRLLLVGGVSLTHLLRVDDTDSTMVRHKLNYKILESLS